MAVRGTPEQIRSDKLVNDTGPEFVPRVICLWLIEADVKTLFIAKGSPWENGYVESFNGTLAMSYSTVKSSCASRKLAG